MFRLGLALFLLAQLCALVHMGVVRHEHCPEHGELVEVSADGHSAGFALIERGHSADGDAEADEHDHCPLLVMPTLAEAEHVVLARDLPTHLDEPAPLGLTSSRAGSIALLRVAPKTSPPRLA